MSAPHFPDWRPSSTPSWGAQDLSRLRQSQIRKVSAMPADYGAVIEEVESGWVGAIISVEASGGIHVVSLEDRRGRVRSFPLGHGFLYEGEPVELTPPTPRAAAPKPTRTASGSVAVSDAPARVARASRIWVEGTHDAELVEKVWGEDLRIEGIVVEPLHGADDLLGAIRAFGPGPQRRVGVLLDHLVPGSKESRIAREVMQQQGAKGNIAVLGHPYVDVWQAVKPHLLGLKRWPDIPRSQDIKVGTLQALGWPHANQRDIAHGWKRILAQVNSYADLEPSLLGRVEELIDFVTVEP
ncbi:DUF3097 domain-containing protein [Nesterenkonia sandarakina]|uniref:DUF3097 family protein n=1 Tax=Nesterenkonia sandarakina TaxID=272918 RepID=A0A2T0YLL2_9MICC|nr:DUF3097 domain-containing protein [Nesterenkonia sandarakina]PRZ16165.1 Protein of unknown function (DUF3097) [Nesterenkonia sandarakina]